MDRDVFEVEVVVALPACGVGRACDLVVAHAVKSPAASKTAKPVLRVRDLREGPTIRTRRATMPVMCVRVVILQDGFEIAPATPSAIVSLEPGGTPLLKWGFRSAFPRQVGPGTHLRACLMPWRWRSGRWTAGA